MKKQWVLVYRRSIPEVRCHLLMGLFCSMVTCVLLLATCPAGSALRRHSFDHNFIQNLFWFPIHFPIKTIISVSIHILDLDANGTFLLITVFCIRDCYYVGLVYRICFDHKQKLQFSCALQSYFSCFLSFTPSMTSFPAPGWVIQRDASGSCCCQCTRRWTQCWPSSSSRRTDAIPLRGLEFLCSSWGNGLAVKPLLYTSRRKEGTYRRPRVLDRSADRAWGRVGVARKHVATVLIAYAFGTSRSMVQATRVCIAHIRKCYIHTSCDSPAANGFV